MESVLLFLTGLITALTSLFQKPDILVAPRVPSIVSTPSPTPFALSIPSQKILNNDGYHIFQTFNNCGPASLSMALSYYGINKSQDELGRSLRPYQNIQGDNDDKSVTLAELAEKAREFGFTVYHRPNGNIEKIKSFIAYDIPVITRTLTKTNEDIGHFRVVKGFDDASGVLIQDDSLQGKNLKYTFQEFNDLWDTFNYEYLVLVPMDKVEIANAILGPEVDEDFSWQKAVTAARSRISSGSNNDYDRLNLSVSLYKIGDYQNSVAEFEKVQNSLPSRTLWYQMEPIKAYYEIGNYEKVFSLTNSILNRGNRAYAEAYLIRGDSYLKQGNTAAARSEYEKAVLYNKNLTSAQEALSKIQ